MKSLIGVVILVSGWIGLYSCHSDSEEYKEILREGSWYVYDIDYSYELYNKYETPELVNFIYYLLEDEMLLFLPGDELTFSKRRVEVRCPNGDRYRYDYYYYGDYIRFGDRGDYMGLLPEGNTEDLTLTFDERALADLFSELAPGNQHYAYLLDATLANLREFHISYHLQRPVPEIAQVMPGIYVGPMYDGNGQLLNEAATLNLFWENGKMNLTLDEEVVLEDESGRGPRFYVDIPDLEVREGRTPGSYEFTGGQVYDDSRFGPVEVQILDGRYNAVGTVTLKLEMVWKENVYVLDFQRGIKRWELQNMQVKSSGKSLVLRK